MIGSRKFLTFVDDKLLNVYDIKALKTSYCIYSLDEHGQLANGKDKEDDCTEEDGCERRRDSGDC